VRLRVAARKTPVRPPRVFAAKPGDVSGSVRPVAAAAARRASYEWQYSIDGGKTWVIAPARLQAKTTLSGLTAGAREPAASTLPRLEPPLLSRWAGMRWRRPVGSDWRGALVFHVSRGEAVKTPFNFVLVALCLFAAWGRRSRAPIAPRG
jgi:hypothetical protein